MYKQQSKFFRRLTLFDFIVSSGLVSPSLPDPDKKKKHKWKRKDKRPVIMTKPLNVIRISKNVIKRIKEQS